ncbi:DUF6428 family protein [Zeaxanthinibacter enoshimensis]|uniref:Uncharacterized protein n=1 Tax=Zeaxanthinibacter enoshimensis TaxID=392009 RepID=A0A4R6TQF0_9FLAO|nr:DUF6428 family protein [Zeaxanthinibacter enoshimensis]TDQ32517.1 hypothetical protein CLV82_0346 [Zeaxanthinibacter enoshimensis]
MKTQEFLELLRQHPDKSLLFEYAPGKLVGANYHITEVKNIIVDSVDCGTGTDRWNETVIQLWESPSELGKTEYLSVYKANGILKKVDRLRKMDREAVLKFEYGNQEFHTAQLHVNSFEIGASELRMQLGVTLTDCKAKESCGIPVESNTPEQETCEPGSGCC